MLENTRSNAIDEIDAKRRQIETLRAPARPSRRQPTRAEAEAAVRTLISWAGDDPEREGLADTPARVIRAYEEWFAGYKQDPAKLLERTFGEVANYRDTVVLRGI